MIIQDKNIKNKWKSACICAVFIGVILCLTGCFLSSSSNTSSENISKKEVAKDIMVKPENQREIYLAGGCFWGVEAYFKKLPGVYETNAGYANGTTENPKYEDVLQGNTGYAETVQVKYDISVIDLETILKAYFRIVEPTSINRQGNDSGTQYRTGIYYTDEANADIIKQAVATEQGKYNKPIQTEMVTLQNFYLAEEYHQDYLEKNPSGYCHLNLNDADTFIQENKLGDNILSDLIKKEDYPVPSDDVLREKLTDIQYRVTQQGETERAFTNAYADNYEAGIYVDVVTGEPMFTSIDKFESGCGWPSFSKPIIPEILTEHEDKSFNMVRTEVRSRAGNIHLGHVFTDGPKELGGLRYCINSASILFIPEYKLEYEGYGFLRFLFEE